MKFNPIGKSSNITALGVAILLLSLAAGCTDIPAQPSQLTYANAEQEEELFSSFWESVASWLGWGSYGTTSDRGDDGAHLVEDNSLQYKHFTHVGKKVIDVLEDEFATEKYRTWNYSGDNTVSPNWILQTPNVWGEVAAEVQVATTCESGTSRCDADFGLLHCSGDSDCDNGGICRVVAASQTRLHGTASKMCVGHSDGFVDEFYKAVTGARDYVDIATLTAPDGRFLAALRNAMTYLENTGRRIKVRVIYGAIPGMGTQELVNQLSRDLRGDGGLSIHAGTYNMGLDSWNHAKIIAVDGKTLITGGHNMWTDHYLTTAPVHDLSMRMQGTIADDAHYFINELWDTTCENYYFSGSTNRAVFPSWRSDCPERWDGAMAELTQTGARVISVARLGALGLDPADKAMLAMIRAAQTSIKLSLQDIGPVQIGAGIALSGWPVEVVEELARAVIRGVDIYLVLSASGSIPGGLNGASANYGNGWAPVDVTTKIGEWLTEHLHLIPGGKNVRNLLCDQFHSGSLRFSSDSTWPADARIGNHAKFFIVDDVAFYLGSQNFYPSNLAEHGLIVDDANTTSQILADYWNPLWEHSGATSVSGFQIENCDL